MTSSLVVVMRGKDSPLPSGIAPSIPASVPPLIGVRPGQTFRKRSAADCSKSSGSSVSFRRLIISR